MFIIIIAIAAVVIISLILIILKTFVSPKKIEAIPRLIKQGKTQNAIKIAKQLIAKDQKNYLAHYYLGKAYVKENRTELAVIEYKNVNDNALFGEGINELLFRSEYSQLLLKYNQQNEALKNFILLTKLDPQNAENFYQGGRIYEDQKRYYLEMCNARQKTCKSPCRNWTHAL